MALTWTMSASGDKDAARAQIDKNTEAPADVKQLVTARIDEAPGNSTISVSANGHQATNGASNFYVNFTSSVP